jgi:hypothetical protein
MMRLDRALIEESGAQRQALGAGLVQRFGATIDVHLMKEPVLVRSFYDIKRKTNQ